jgi:hypothetical protein
MPFYGHTSERISAKGQDRNTPQTVSSYAYTSTGVYCLTLEVFASRPIQLEMSNLWAVELAQDL